MSFGVNNVSSRYPARSYSQNKANPQAGNLAEYKQYIYSHISRMYGWKCDIDKEYYLSCSASSADGPLLSAMLIKKTPGAMQDESPGIEIRYCDVEAFVERGETVVRHSNVTKPA